MLSKKYVVSLALVELVLLLFLLIIINSIRTKGAEVNYSTHTVGDVLCGNQGFDIDGNTFKQMIADQRYATFYHYNGADEFVIVFDSYADKDYPVTIWEMDETGTVLKEYNSSLNEDCRWIFLDDIDTKTSLISIGIDKDFCVYEIISATSYSNSVIKPLLIVATIMVLLIILLVLAKVRVAEDKIVALYDSVVSMTHNKRILKKIIIHLVEFFISIVLSVVAIRIIELSKLIDVHSNYKTYLLLTFIVYIVFLCIYDRKQFSKRIELLGLVIIFTTTSFYAILEPSSNGVSWDDEFHFERASAVSHIIDGKKSFSDVDIRHYYQAVALDRATYSKESSNKFNEMVDFFEDRGYFTRFDRKVISYAYIVFLPMSIGMTIARGLTLPYHVCIIFGRLFNALFVALCCYFSMKKLKYGKIIVLLVALIPTLSFMSGSYSYDPWLIVFCLLGFSYIFGERQIPDDKMSWSSIVLIPLFFWLANLMKLVYFVLAIPAYFISGKKFKNVWQSLIYKALVTLSIVLPFIIVALSNIINAGSGDARGGEAVNQASQLDFIKENIQYVVGVVFEFLKGYLNPLVIGNQRMHYLGYNGIIPGYLITLIIILIGACLHHGDNKKTAFPIWYRLGMIVLYIGVAVICAVTFYAAFTPVGADYIAGCQARYLLPVTFPLLYVLTRIPIKTYVLEKVGEHNVNMILCFLMFMINAYCVWKGCVIYY